MRRLAQLGFVARRRIESDLIADSVRKQGLDLPSAYVQFLCFSPPKGKIFGFKFKRGTGGEEWEGQVNTFFDYAENPAVLEPSILRSHSRLLLPIACDAGGNEIYIDMLSKGQVVVDHDYQTGELSIIAPNFEAFVDGLYEIE